MPKITLTDSAGKLVKEVVSRRPGGHGSGYRVVREYGEET